MMPFGRTRLRFALMLAVMTVCGIAASSAQATNLGLHGDVVCTNGAPVAGVYIYSNTGGGAFANWTPIGNGSAAYYWLSITTGLPAHVQIRAGCGRTSQPGQWATTNRTGYIGTNGGTFYINTFCNGAGACQLPADVTGQHAAGNLGQVGQCTYGALSAWRSATGFYPNFASSNAGQWGTTMGQAGWTVTSVPMPRSIVVMPSAAGGVGHVAWVNSVSVSHGAVVINVFEENYLNDGKGETRNFSYAADPSYLYVAAPID